MVLFVLSPLREDDFGSRRDIRDYEWRKMADDMNANIPSGRIAIYPVDWGGRKKLERLGEYLDSRFIGGETLLQAEGDDMHHEYRQILTKASDVMVPADYGVVFDDWGGAVTGKSLTGGIRWLLENSEEFGFKKCYIACMIDFSRMAPFAGRREYDPDEYMGLLEGIRTRAPSMYAELEAHDLTRKVGDRKNPIKVRHRISGFKSKERNHGVKQLRKVFGATE